MNQHKRGWDKGTWGILGFVGVAMGLGLWLLVRDIRVASVQPLGNLSTLGTPAGEAWISGQGIETPTAYYPLLGKMAFDKGVSLVLATAEGGARHICDDQLKVCVRTSRVGKHIAEVGAAR